MREAETGYQAVLKKLADGRAKAGLKTEIDKKLALDTLLGSLSGQQPLHCLLFDLRRINISSDVLTANSLMKWRVNIRR